MMQYKIKLLMQMTNNMRLLMITPTNIKIICGDGNKMLSNSKDCNKCPILKRYYLLNNKLGNKMIGRHTNMIVVALRIYMTP